MGERASFETLRVEVSGAVGTLTLDREKKLNPLSHTTLSELCAAARYFDEQRGVKIVIVRGAGRAFSAGADLSSFVGTQQVSVRDAADLGRQMADEIEGMRALTIAAIHGWCIGGGLVLAAACDLRLAANDARFSIPEVDLGIPLAWGGIPRLVREIGPARTKELVNMSRVAAGSHGLASGCPTRSTPPDDLDRAPGARAETLARKAAYPLFATKRHVNAVTDQMLGMVRSWSDADGLVTAIADEECGTLRRAYLANRRGTAD